MGIWTSAPASTTTRSSIDLGNELALGQRCLVVVGVLLRPAWQLDLLPLDLLVRNLLQQMRDDIEARALLVVRPDDVPRGELGIGGLQHGITGDRILVPLGA